MTLKKIDYSKLVVYKIVCNDLRVTDLYVGSTTNFEQRKKQHKNRCYDTNSEKYHYQLYESIRKFGGWQNWSMIIVERCPCSDSYEARKLERFYYEQLNANLNMVRPLCTEEELKQMNKEYKQKEEYKEKQKLYRDEHKDKMLEYREKNKDKMLEYRENNKDKIQETRTKYYNENKDVINVNRKEKFTCSCGSIIARGGKSKHEKTFIHISKTQPLFHNQDEIHA